MQDSGSTIERLNTSTRAELKTGQPRMPDRCVFAVQLRDQEGKDRNRACCQKPLNGSGTAVLPGLRLPQLWPSVSVPAVTEASHQLATLSVLLLPMLHLHSQALASGPPS
jgi:hypothetical protein